MPGRGPAGRRRDGEGGRAACPGGGGVARSGLSELPGRNAAGMRSPRTRGVGADRNAPHQPETRPLHERGVRTEAWRRTATSGPSGGRGRRAAPSRSGGRRCTRTRRRWDRTSPGCARGASSRCRPRPWRAGRCAGHRGPTEHRHDAVAVDELVEHGQPAGDRQRRGQRGEVGIALDPESAPAPLGQGAGGSSPRRRPPQPRRTSRRRRRADRTGTEDAVLAVLGVLDRSTSAKAGVRPPVRKASMAARSPLSSWRAAGADDQASSSRRWRTCRTSGPRGRPAHGPSVRQFPRRSMTTVRRKRCAEADERCATRARGGRRGAGRAGPRSTTDSSYSPGVSGRSATGSRRCPSPDQRARSRPGRSGCWCR